MPLFAQSPQAVVYYQQAETLFEQDKDTEALALLHKAIGDSPQYEQAILLRARCYVEMEQTERAIQDFKVLTRLSPKNSYYWLEKGTFLQQIGDYDNAENDYLEAYNLDSTKIEVLNALGELYQVTELYKDALKFLNKAVAIDSKTHETHYTRAWVYYETKRNDLALADIKVCEGLKKDDANTLRLKALCFLKQKKYEEVFKIFDGFADKKIKFVEEDFLYWGMAYYDKGDYKNALFYLEAPETPTLPDLPYYIGKAYFKQGNYKKSLEKLDSTLLMLKTKDVASMEGELSAPVYYDRAIVHQKVGKAKEANADLLQACYLTPEIAAQKDYDGESISLLGDALALLKPIKNTIDSICLKGYQDRAEALVLSGDVNRAWAEVKKCEDLDSLHARNAWLRAKIYIITGKYTEGLKELNKSEALPKGSSIEEIAYLRAIAYQELGEMPKAKQAIETAMKQNPQADIYKSLWADIAYESNNYTEATEAINQAIKSQPQNLGYYIQRAIYLQATANYEPAIKDCNKVIEAEPDNAEAYYQRGLAYKATKRYKEALADFQKVQQYAHNDAEINDLIRDVTGK